MSIILIASFTFKSWHDMHRWLKHCKAEITHFAAIKSWLVFHLAKKKKGKKRKKTHINAAPVELHTSSPSSGVSFAISSIVITLAKLDRPTFGVGFSRLPKGSGRQDFQRHFCA